MRAEPCSAYEKNRVRSKRGLSKLNSVAQERTIRRFHDQVDVLPGFRIHRDTDSLGDRALRLEDADLRCWSPQIPRKEVIQPHLPVRLPCYDFTPITEPTFDGSLPCGLGHRLRVSPTFVV